MRLYLLLGCIVGTFSFLIGGYMNSWGLGWILFLGCNLGLYWGTQHFYTRLFYTWGITVLAGATTLLWTSFFDKLLGTTFIAITLGILAAIGTYLAISRFLENREL